MWDKGRLVAAGVAPKGGVAMSRKVIAAALPVLVSLALTGVVSCRSMQRSLKEAPPDPPEVTPTQLDFVDADGFDALFETALTN